MKELQNFVYRHMDALKHHKRYLAMLTALSMLVTFIVPLILVEPADSMTGILVCNKTVHTHNAECYDGNTLVCDIEEHIHTGECYKKLSTVSLKGNTSEDTYTDYNIPVSNAGGGYDKEEQKYIKADGNTVDGVIYNPKELPLYTLLFGEGENHWVDTSKSLEENLQIANTEYFLGFASDFCAFIESDFTATEADAEGRMFVGGDLSFKKEWNYQIGSGDYGRFKPLSETEEYNNISNYASAIVGGKLYRINTLSTGHTDHVNANLSVAGHRNKETVFYKPEKGLYKSFIVGNIADSLHYVASDTSDKAYTTDFAQCMHDYPGDCENCSHQYLLETNELSQLYQYSDVSTILEKTFDTVRARSLSISNINGIPAITNGSTAVLDARGIEDDATVYFDLGDSWNGFSSIKIYVSEDKIKPSQWGTYTNGEGKVCDCITDLDLNIIVNCGAETINFGNVSTEIITTKDGQEVSTTISNTGSKESNNHIISSNILYNFYNAKKVEMYGNFNGTILAPNADAESDLDGCPGHLSGALIAKSFKGGLEFGYRPYRGGTDIFGMTSGYEVPVDKLIANTNQKLPGAIFAVKEGDDVISLFESGDETGFAALPSKVDFSGKTAYRFEHLSKEANQNKSYAGDFVTGEKLTAPVKISAYTSLDCSEESKIGETIPPIGKFYLKANQKIHIDWNENFNFNSNPVTENNNEYIYTIDVIKAVDKLEINAKASVDHNISSVITIDFEQVDLNISPETVEVGSEFTFEIEKPLGDGYSYQYFVNGNAINNNYTTDSFINYKPQSTGNISVYAKVYHNVDNNNRLVAETIPKEVTVNGYTMPEMSISIPKAEVINNEKTITSGNNITIDIENLPQGAKVLYKFYNSELTSGNEFSTNGIVGKNLPLYAKVEINGETAELNSTITVNFKDDIKFNGNLPTEYTLKQDAQPIQLSSVLDNVSYNNLEIKFRFNNKEESFYNSVYPNVIGEIPVVAVLTANGLTKEITTSIKVKYLDIKLQMPNDSYYVGEDVSVTAYSVPNGYTIIAKFNNEPQSVTGNNNQDQTITFNPENPGTYELYVYKKYGENVLELIDSKSITINEIPTTTTTTTTTVSSQNQEETTTTTVVLEEIYIQTDNEVYYAGDTVKLTIVGLPDGVTVSTINSLTIEGQNVSYNHNNGNEITFVTSEQYYDKQDGYKLALSATLTNNESINLNTIIYNYNPNNRPNNVLLKLKSFSRRSAANTNTTDNLITIDAPTGSTIGKLLITFTNEPNAKNSEYKLKATFSYADGEPTYEYYTKDNVNDSDPDYLEINAAEGVTKIEIESIQGTITIDKCYPTYVEKADKITKDYSTGFKINNGEEYTITLEDWVTSLAGMTFDLKNNDKNVATGGKLSYTLLDENDNELGKAEVAYTSDPVSIDVMATPNVKKIKIKAVDLYLSVDAYSISSYKELGFEESTIPVNENSLPIVGEYTLVEQQAPAGYFKNDELVYTITVEENITKISRRENSIYPNDVITTINVKSNQQDSQEITLYTIKISYGTEINGDSENVINPDVRIIQVLDKNDTNNVTDTFRLTKGIVYGKDTLLKVEYSADNGNNYSELNNWDKLTPDDYTIGEGDDAKSFYFDAISMMIIPVDNNHLNFENEKGLLFRKVDDKGAAVNSVQIDLYKNNEKVSNTNIWNWIQNNTSECLLPLSNDENGIQISTEDQKYIYRFHESNTGGKYENALDIYIERVGKSTIHYWTPTEDGDTTKPANPKILDLNSDNVIRMENTRITGIKLYLEKTDMSGGTIGTETDFAKFCLHANDGTELLHNIEVIKGKVELDFSGFDENDTTYVENGYLKPGTYYFKEMQAPSNYAASTKNFYFNVVQSDDGAFTVEPTEKIPGVSYTEETQTDGKVHRFTRFKSEALKQISDGIKAGTIENNTPIIQFKFKTGNGEYGDNGWGNAKFYALINDETVAPAKYPEGCFVHSNGNGIYFKNETVTVKLTPAQLCELFNISIDSIGTISEFVVESWNSTTIEDIDFYPLENSDEPEGGTVESIIPTITTSGNVIKISNEELGTEMNLRVDKKWEGDDGLEKFRKSVEVQLQQREGENGKYIDYHPIIDANETATGGNVILNSENNWTYTWEDLPRFVENNIDGEKYYYRVIENTSITGYTKSTSGSDINEGGTIVITNTLDAIDIPVTKNWNKNSHEVSLPETIKVKLQAEINGEMIDIPGKTLLLSGENDNWSGVFEDLPKGYKYEVTEVDAPFGWNVSYDKREIDKTETNTSPTNGFVITNTYEIATGSIAIQKLWQDLTGSSTLPYSLTVDLYRSVIAPSYTETDYTETDLTQNYARLLQHSLYFYDTNMCGDDVAASSAIAWRTNCHVNDEVQGGYHDAGDHVMFGLAQGFSASTLGWNFYEFNTTAENGNKVYDNSCQTEHYKMIMKRFCDFFVDATVYNGGNIQKVLMQKGKGNKGDDTNHDHTYWGPPEDQPDLYVSGITRPMMWQENGSGTGGNVAAQYAASLALYYLNFPNDPDSANYLNVAKDLFEFAKNNSNAFSIGNYGDGSSAEEIAWAAVWLALATDNESYYINDSVKSTLTDGGIPGRGHYWENPLLGAKTVYACHIEPKGTTTIKDKVTSFLSDCSGDNYKIFDGWGSARHNTLNQLAALAMDKNFNTNYREWCAKQTGYLLGNNHIPSNGNDSTCFVTGYAPNSARNAHHRAASGYDAGEYDNKGATACVDHYDEENGKILIGALVGGPKDSNDNSGSYSDIMDGQMAWETNEVALDYNAGLVGAAAGLYYFNNAPEKNELSDTIVGVEFNKYGLADPASVEYGVKSPVKSAVSEAKENDGVNVNVKKIVLNAFAMKQTAVSINEDSIDNISKPYVPSKLEYTEYSIPTVIQNYITEIEVTFNGTYGTGALVIYGNNNNQTQHPYNISNSKLLSIDVTNPVTKFSLNKWDGGDQSIKEINVHWQLPLIITPETYFVEAKTPFDVVPSNQTGEITWNFGDTGFSEHETENTKLIAPSKPGTYTIRGTDKDNKTDTFDVEVIPSGSVVRDISLGTINKQGWTTWGIPGDLGPYGVNKVVFKFNKQVNVNWYTFKLKEDGAEVEEVYNFNNIPESLYYGFPLTPSDSVSFGLWSNDVDSLPEYMYLICSPPTLSITTENNKTNVTEGDTIRLESKDEKEGSTVTWKLNGEVVKDGDTYDFTAPVYVEDGTNEYTITASDGTNTATKTLTVDPLAFTEDSIIIEGFNTQHDLELNSDRPLDSFNWDPLNSPYIVVENGTITAKKTTTDPITIIATDKNNLEISASIQVSANVPVEDLAILGESSTGIGGEISLKQSGGPHEALSYKWISSDTSTATVDQNGKVTGVAAGTVTITLEAYSGPNQTGTVLDFVEKTITIKNVRNLTFHNQGIETDADGDKKYFISLSKLPAGAKLKKVTIHVTPTNGQDTDYEGALMLGKENSSPEPWEQMNISGRFSGSGETITIDNTKDSNNGDKINMDIIDCSKHDFCFGLWSKSCTVNIDWVTFEYEMDSTFIEIKYDNYNNDTKTIRKGQSVSVTVTATGGEIGSVQLKNGDTVVQDLGTGGSYTITPENEGNYTIVAAMAGELSNRTSSIALTVKDNITVNGDYKMDFNSSQTLDVNNKIGTITWAPVGEIGTDYTVDGNIVTFKNADKEIAVFNTSTGDVTVFEESGSFTVKATDSYDNTFTEFEISISERPKVPVLPKNEFVQKIELTNADRVDENVTDIERWKKIVSGLPLVDEKGNQYYYYIQESGYEKTENSGFIGLTDERGHYIYSDNSTYMPISYFNNGILPVQKPDANNPIKIVTVGNKLTETMQGQLPSTGGSGVTTYYYLGGVIMLLSIAGFTGLKRRERKRRKE